MCGGTALDKLKIDLPRDEIAGELAFSPDIHTPRTNSGVVRTRSKGSSPTEPAMPKCAGIGARAARCANYYFTGRRMELDGRAT